MDILTKAIAILGVVFGATYYVFRQGKQAAKSEQNEEIIKNVKKINKRKTKRANDSIDVVKQRLSKFIRR